MNTTREEVMFPTLTDEQILYVADKGVEIQLQAGDMVFREGDPAEHLYIVLDGEIRITRRVGNDETLITTHTPGQFTGELSLLTGGKSVASGRAVTNCRLLKIDAASFRSILGQCAPMTNTLVQALAVRHQDVETLTQQREKLASLGMLAAGLAHELNNPAGAALSGVETLRETFHRQQALTLSLHRSAVSPDQHEFIIHLACDVTAESADHTPLDPITQSDREEELIAWLDEHQVEDGYELAPTFVAFGMDTARLETLAARVNPDVLGDTLAWLEAMLKMKLLMDQIQSSTGRVTKLVQSIKKYSYMDQAPIQEIDVHEGLDDTLTMLGYKLKKYSIAVHREYAPDLPRICAYGSELNQAWTNLLVNAIDALNDKADNRALWIRTKPAGDSVIVEIEDNGPGIPAVLQDRIFDPFFTTKEVGKGTGMGLDITRRIIEKRHRGELKLSSEPGRTCFSIRLLLAPPHDSK